MLLLKNVPAKQGIHAVFPNPTAYVPELHGVQKELEPEKGEAVPAGHAAHTALPVPCTYVPCGHSEHSLAAEVDENRPGGQAEQDVAGAVENDPAAQLAHVEPSKYWPAAQVIG